MNEFTPTSDLCISEQTRLILSENNIDCIEQLEKMSDEEIYNIKGLNFQSTREVTCALMVFHKKPDPVVPDSEKLQLLGKLSCLISDLIKEEKEAA